MAASREKVLYFEPQPSEQTAALKTVLVRMGVRIKNVEAVSAGQTVGFLLNRKGFEPTDETADAPSAPMMVLDGFTEKRLDILLREMKAYGVSVPYKAMVTEHNIGWTLSDLLPSWCASMRLCTNDRTRTERFRHRPDRKLRSVLPLPQGWG